MLTRNEVEVGSKLGRPKKIVILEYTPPSSKKRGRPRKVVEEAPAVVKKRGRPKKVAVEGPVVKQRGRPKKEVVLVKRLGRPVVKGPRKGVVIYLPAALKDGLKAHCEYLTQKGKTTSMTDFVESLVTKALRK